VTIALVQPLSSSLLQVAGVRQKETQEVLGRFMRVDGAVEAVGYCLGKISRVIDVRVRHDDERDVGHLDALGKTMTVVDVVVVLVESHLEQESNCFGCFECDLEQEQ